MSKTSTIIGLTGNIGTGKSTVLTMLRERGAFVIDADLVAHAVMAPSGPAYHAIVELFGEGIIAPGGTIDRARLGEIVFNDAGQLSLLEQVVHPIVFEEISAQIDAAEEPIIVIEAIKLLESGLTLDLCDQVWVVTAPVEQQIQRLMDTRQMSRGAAEARMALQSPQTYKTGQADVVLDNSGTIADLEVQVDAAWRQLTTPISSASV